MNSTSTRSTKSRDHVRNQRWIFAKLGVLVGILVQGQHAATDRVAGGVVAADDEQDEVAEIFHRLHVSCRFSVRQHRNEIVAGFGVDALVPKLREERQTLEQLFAPLLVAFDHAGVRIRGRNVGPARKLVPLFERKVEKCGQHLRCELDRHEIHPVERLVAR